MRKVFWDDPYQTTLTTTVQQLKNNVALFAETIAFSFSGGQESDLAYVNGFQIMNSRIESNLIYYTLDPAHNIKVGDQVEMSINWQRRYNLMRLHFAAELVLELVTRRLHCKKIGAHIAENKSRIDFSYHENISTIFDDVTRQYNDIINADLPILTGFSDVIAQKRYWEIQDFQRVPCGGTHVKSTAEVGYVRLKRKNIGNAKERIEILLTTPS